MSNKYSSFDHKILRKWYLDDNLSQEVIGNRLGVNKKTVAKALKHFNICRSRGPWLNRDWLYNQYIVQQKSRNQIARDIDKSTTYVRMLLEKFGIPKRAHDDPINRSKISESSKAKWEDSGYRNAVIEGNRKKWQDDEYRKKMGEIRDNQLYQVPKTEKLLHSILDDLGIKYEKWKKFGYYEFDVYLPNYNILIESQSIWHEFKENRDRDKRKANFILNNFPNLTLKYIWERDYYCDGYVSDLIQDWCGIKKLKQEDFSFEDVQIRYVDGIDEAIDFVSKHHYAGKLGNNQLRYGAYLGDTLIALCVFGGITRKESAARLGLHTKEVKELTRFCVHRQYHKKNFATWFISRCIKILDSRKLHPKSRKCKCILTFADTTFGHNGTIYKAANFIFDGVVKPSYWYVNSANKIMHKKTLWDRASKHRMTETEYAHKYGFSRIDGDEKHRYLYWLDKQAKRNYLK